MRYTLSNCSLLSLFASLKLGDGGYSLFQLELWGRGLAGISGLDTTIDAQAALSAIIRQRYGREISGEAWSTVSSADDPPDGLGSSDATDWLMTLDKASEEMVGKGYGMSPISRTEAGDARGDKLDASVVLIVNKSSSQDVRKVAPVDAKPALSSWQKFAMAIGLAAFTGAAIVASGRIRKSVRRAGRAK